ncbi:helix-turn-helix transcriptional regulator [Dyadobacter jiangsuensis]
METTTGGRFRDLRGRKSLADFATSLGVTPQQISRIENGQSKPSLDLAEKVCEIYNVSLDWLLRGIVQADTPDRTGPNATAGEITISIEEYARLTRKALENEEKRNEALQHQLDQLKNT